MSGEQLAERSDFEITAQMRGVGITLQAGTVNRLFLATFLSRDDESTAIFWQSRAKLFLLVAYCLLLALFFGGGV